MSSNYGENSITALEEEEKVRKRPAVIFGTDDEYGCAHGIFEIIANSVDEYREGFGSKISIKLYVDGSIEVKDNGRGVPLGWNEKANKFNWQLVFCTLYASGKYDSSSYSESLGLNGLGATAIQFASEWFVVESVRNDGKKYSIQFKKGKPTGELKIDDAGGEVTGTRIVFKPDVEVFSSIWVPVEYYIDVLRRMAMVNGGLDISLYSEETDKEIHLYYENGSTDYIEAVCRKPMVKDVVSYAKSARGYDDTRNTDEYELKMKIALNFSRDAGIEEIYHNGSYLSEGGVTQVSLRNGLARAFETYMKENSKLGKNDKLNYKDIESLIVVVADTSCPGNRTSFKNQTKLAINNPFIKRAYEEFVYDSITNWLNTNKDECAKVVGAILENKMAREEADKVSKKVIQKLSKNPNTIGNRPQKFVNCTSDDVSIREVYVVEGDSASGACKLSRDSSFQAIMPVRGKIMNCLKEKLVRIFGSEIIVDLLSIFECGVEVKSKYIKDLPAFDIKKLKWDKIIICTDADLDGMQIRCLIITMIYRLIPSVLKAGKVYIAETPLFEINVKGQTKFAYTLEEKNDIISKLHENGFKDSQIDIQRSKGLGENEPEMMSISTMAPATRRLVQIEYPENDEGVAKIFNALLGDDLETRKFMIEEYFEFTAECEE